MLESGTRRTEWYSSTIDIHTCHGVVATGEESKVSTTVSGSRRKAARKRVRVGAGCERDDTKSSRQLVGTKRTPD